jgi:hypothetical protein
MKYINLPVFLVSLAVGLFFVYTTNSPKKDIFVFPNPDTINDVQYKDKTNTCFEFKAREIPCTGDVHEYKVQ